MNCVISKTARLERLYHFSDLHLTGNYQYQTRLTTGDLHFDTVFLGTLQSFFDRLDTSGFCPTSFGEEGLYTAYGIVDYARDSAEAALALAEMGRPDLTDKILSFNLDHIPAGQYWVPHIYWKNGTVAINNIQVDTLAHQTLALQEAVALDGATPLRHRLFRILANLFHQTEIKHFHSEIHLFEAGNYNETGFEGSSDKLVEIYTNSVMEAGYRAMAWMSGMFNEGSNEKYTDFEQTLSASIEEHFAGEPAQGYWVGMQWPSCEKIEMLYWLPLLSQHWHKGKITDREMLWRQLVEKTSISWDGMRVVTCEPPRDQYKLTGKIFASQLAYMAETGRYHELEELINFASRTISHPLNLFPEWWFHHRPENPRGCYTASIENTSAFYESYCDNPNGDYTYDSGNCEQCAFFLHDVWNSLAGISIRPEQVRIAPALCSPMSLNHGPHDLTWRWDGKKTFDFQMDRQTNWLIRLPILQDFCGHVLWNEQPIAFQRVHGEENDWIDLKLLACSAGKITLQRTPGCL